MWKQLVGRFDLRRHKLVGCVLLAWSGPGAALLFGQAPSAPQVLPSVPSLPTSSPQVLPSVPLVPTANFGLPTGYTYGLDLAHCRVLACQQQPTILAAQDTLAAAQARARAVHQLCIPTFMSPDLPCRRAQACIGINIAQAGVTQAQADAVYNATRMYLTYIYARRQQAIGQEALNKLKDVLKDFQEQDVGRRIDKARVMVSVGEARLEKASKGAERAKAALREALALPADCPLEISDCALPEIALQPQREEVLALALARRGDLTQAQLLVKVTACEVCAQSALRGPLTRTFAAGSDIHARPVPAASTSADYKPGALAPEMPVTLAGKRPYRVEQAKIYETRAAHMVDKTRHLIVLEAENEYLQFQEGYEAQQKLKKASEEAKKYLERVEKLRAKGLTKPDEQDELLTANVFVTQIELDQNEALFQAWLALAGLERVTSGGFCPGFDNFMCIQPTSTQKKEKPDDKKEKPDDKSKTDEKAK